VARLEKVRLSLSRDAELRTDAFKKYEELKIAESIKQENLIKEQSILSSAKIKLEALAEYNRKNHAGYSINKKVPNNEIETLTATEKKCLVDKINSDPNAPQALKNKIVKGSIEGKISINHDVIKYLNTLSKK
jgi:hypothetical protein